MTDTPTPSNHDEMCAALRTAITFLDYHVSRKSVASITLRSALEQLEANRWQPIAEFPPNDADIFDFWLEWADDCADFNPPLGQSRFSHEQRFRGYHRGWSSVYKATHFMPLPAPPATASEGSDLYRKVMDSDAGRALRESMKKD